MGGTAVTLLNESMSETSSSGSIEQGRPTVSVLAAVLFEVGQSTAKSLRSPDGETALEEALTAMFGSPTDVVAVCLSSETVDGRCVETMRLATTLNSDRSLAHVGFRIDVEFDGAANLTDVLATVQQLESGSGDALSEFASEFEATFARLDIPVQVLNVLQTPQPPQTDGILINALTNENQGTTDRAGNDALGLIVGIVAGAALLLFGLVSGVIIVRLRRKAERKPETVADDARVDNPHDAVVLPNEAMGTLVKITKVEPDSNDTETPSNDGTVQIGDAEEMTLRNACAAFEQCMCKGERCAVSSDSLSTCIDSTPLDAALSQSSLVSDSGWDK